MRRKRFGIGSLIVKRFYRCTIESIVSGSINAWQLLGVRLQGRVVCTAQYITGAKLPAIQDVYIRRCQWKAQKLSKTTATLVIDGPLCYRMGTVISVEN